MAAKMVHTCIHVLDLDASMRFYEDALGLTEDSRLEPEDKSWAIVFLGNDTTDFRLELTWNKGRTEPYENGTSDTHLAFEVDDMDEAHHVHERMDCIVHENKGMGIYFITDPDGCWIEIIPSSKIQLNDAFVIGIDVGGTATKLGVFTGSGELVGKHAFASIPVLTKEAFTPIAEQLAIILRASSVSASQVVGVGLAVPGPVTPENEFVVCPNLDLDLHAYKSFLEAEFPKAAVAVINDANAAALGDQWQGSASKSACENFVLVTLGTGIGAGIISRGELLTSSAGAVGEIGHLCVEPVDG
ncbi:MAG: ROK family protein, partial [Raoultibacter sp.]